MVIKKFKVLKIMYSCIKEKMFSHNKKMTSSKIEVDLFIVCNLNLLFSSVLQRVCIISEKDIIV